MGPRAPPAGSAGSGRALRLCALAVLLVSAGCLGGPGPGPGSGDATPTPSPTASPGATGDPAGTTTELPDPTPGPGDAGAPTATPAAGPSDEAAIDRARAAEGDYVAARLRNASCLDDYAVGGPVSPPASTVVVRNSTGVYVRAHHAYTWNRDGRYADLYSTGLYRVTGEDAERLRGTTVAPCAG